MPPWVCMAASSAASAASAAAYLAMFDASPAGSPRSCSHAALRVISAASSVSIFAWASGCATPWCAPIGGSHTARVARVAAAAVQGVAGDPDAQRGAGDPLRVEPVEDLPEALALLADQRVGGQPDVVEEQA